MIKLRKIQEPSVLTDNKAEWTTSYNNHLSSEQPIPDSLKYKYRHPEIKRRILEETHEKCAYCESKVTHVHPGDIEHIAPKSKRPDLIFEWLNLTLSCQECNRRKGDYHDPDLPLIDPYNNEPSDHFFFAGPMIFHRPGSERGRFTKTKLELNRPPLFERRKEQLESIINLLDLWSKCNERPAKAALLGELMRGAHRDKEYSCMVETFLRTQGVV